MGMLFQMCETAEQAEAVRAAHSSYPPTGQRGAMFGGRPRRLQRLAPCPTSSTACPRPHHGVRPHRVRPGSRQCRRDHVGSQASTLPISATATCRFRSASPAIPTTPPCRPASTRSSAACETHGQGGGLSGRRCRHRASTGSDEAFRNGQLQLRHRPDDSPR